MLGGVKSKLIEAAAKWWLARFIGDIEAGKMGGPRAKAIVVAVKGRKRLIGGLIALVAAGLYTFNPDTYALAAAGLGSVGAVVVHLGFMDKVWRSEPPPAWVSEVLTYLFGMGTLLGCLLEVVKMALKLWPDCTACPEFDLRVTEWSEAIVGVSFWMLSYTRTWAEPASSAGAPPESSG